MNPIVKRSQDGAVARLTLSDPARHNALSLDMIQALTEGLADIAQNDAIRVVILAAEGKAFCPGHDLREMQAMREAEDGPARLADLFQRCAALMQAIPALPQPVIAQVQGVATAAGCQLVASCDLAVASEAARFGVNGISIGLFCATPMVALSRAIPPRIAFELLATGDFIPAARAAELGLVNRVTTPDALEATTDALAGSIADKLPAAIRMGKRAFHDQSGQDIEEAYRTTIPVICRNMMREDTAGQVADFLNRRARPS